MNKKPKPGDKFLINNREVEIVCDLEEKYKGKYEIKFTKTNMLMEVSKDLLTKKRGD